MHCICYHITSFGQSFQSKTIINTVNANEPTVENNPSYQLVTKIWMDSTSYDKHVCGGLSVGDGMTERGKHEEENSKV